MDTIQRYDEMLFNFFIEERTYEGNVQLTIDPQELKCLLEQNGLGKFEEFERRVKSRWVALATSGTIYKRGFLSIVALQIALGFGTGNTNLGERSYIKRILGKYKKKNLFCGKDNEYKAGNSKQYCIWKSVSKEFEKRGIVLDIPEAKTGKYRYLQYPKQYVLLRRQDIQYIVKNIISKVGVDRLGDINFEEELFSSWQSFKKYTTSAIRNQLLKGDKDQASNRQYLAYQQIKRHLNAELILALEEENDKLWNEGRSKQVIQRKARTNNRVDYIIELYSQPVSNEPPKFKIYNVTATQIVEVQEKDFIEVIKKCPRLFAYLEDSEDEYEIVHTCSKSPNESGTHILLEYEEGKLQVKKYNNYNEYATAKKIKNKLLIERPRVIAGLRSQRSQTFLQGYGPVFAPHERLSYRHIPHLEAIYCEHSAICGMWTASIDQQNYNFSIEVPKLDGTIPGDPLQLTTISCFGTLNSTHNSDCRVAKLVRSDRDPMHQPQIAISDNNSDYGIRHYEVQHNDHSLSCTNPVEHLLRYFGHFLGKKIIGGGRLINKALNSHKIILLREPNQGLAIAAATNNANIYSIQPGLEVDVACELLSFLNVITHDKLDQTRYTFVVVDLRGRRGVQETIDDVASKLGICGLNPTPSESLVPRHVILMLAVGDQPITSKCPTEQLQCCWVQQANPLTWEYLKSVSDSSVYIPVN